MTERVILHLDMDAFYASIEQREDASLRGRPVIVGHRGARGVVTTCSYEARPFGVRSAMPSVTAERLCPGATWLSPRMDLYREESRAIFRRVERAVPVVEMVSIDEAYGDLSGLAASPAAARGIAEALRREIREAHALTASIGLAPNRFLAKVASDLEKPDGLTVIGPTDVGRVLGPLPVRVIPGVGPKLGERLARMGLRTIADLRRRSEASLVPGLGARTARFLARRARGEDDRPVEPSAERKQVSEERTYRDDLVTRPRIERELLARAEGVAATLRRKRLLARTVTVKVRDGAYRTVTRSLTLDEPTDLPGEIYRVACGLVFGRIDLGGRGVRLLGVAARELCRHEEVPRLLFPDPRRERERRVLEAGDALRERFGRQVLGPARLIDPGEPDGSGPEA